MLFNFDSSDLRTDEMVPIPRPRAHVAICASYTNPDIYTVIIGVDVASQKTMRIFSSRMARPHPPDGIEDIENPNSWSYWIGICDPVVDPCQFIKTVTRYYRSRIIGGLNVDITIKAQNIKIDSFHLPKRTKH